jgi:O-antigen/teichoic acid export membrane protein
LHLKLIARNVLSTWFGYIATLLVGFFLAPFILHHVGNTGYGVWTLIVSLTGYFGLLDLGLRQSVGRFVARHIALKESRGVNETLNTAIAMLSAAGFLVLVAAVLITVFFKTAFKVEPQYEHAARLALLIAGANVSMALPMSVFSTILMSLERFDVMTGITVFSAITRATFVVIALSSGHGIIALAMVTIFASASEYLATFSCAKYLYRPLAVSWRSISIAKFKELFHFGIYRFVWIIANQLIFYTDSVVIGVFLGAASITYYAIAGSLVNYGRNIVSLASDTLYPAATRYDSTNDFEGLRKLLILGTQLGLFIGIPLCCGYFFLGSQFIRLWMGPGYNLSATILVILTVPQIFSMSQYASGIILVGMARHKILAQVAFVEGVVNLALSIILAKKIGLIGVAVGTVIPHMISTMIVVPIYTLRVVRLSVRQYIVSAYGGPLLCGLPTALLAYAFSVLVHRPSVGIFAGEALALGGTFMILVYFISLTGTQREYVNSSVRRYTLGTPAGPELENIPDEVRF